MTCVWFNSGWAPRAAAQTRSAPRMFRPDGLHASTLFVVLAAQDDICFRWVGGTNLGSKRWMFFVDGAGQLRSSRIHSPCITSQFQKWQLNKQPGYLLLAAVMLNAISNAECGISFRTPYCFLFLTLNLWGWISKYFRPCQLILILIFLLYLTYKVPPMHGSTVSLFYFF